MSQSLIQAQTETATVKSQIIDLQDTIDRLQHEKEELSLIQSSSVTGDEAYNEIVKLNTALNTEITSLKQFIQSQHLTSSSQSTAESSSSSLGEVESLREQVRREQQLVIN